MYGHHEIAKMLLKADASVKGLSFGSFWRAAVVSVCSNCDVQITPLHMAAYMGDLKITHMLLDRLKNSLNDASLETDFCKNSTQSYNDISPLWFSLLKGHDSIVKLYLSLGKPIAPSCHFGSGLQVCLQEGHTAVAQMLLRAGYDLDDDMEWIQAEEFPTGDQEVIDKIVALVEKPRPLWECCAFALRDKFGLSLQGYLKTVGAPQKICNILDFNDLSKESWMLTTSDMEQLSLDDSKNYCIDSIQPYLCVPT